SHGALDLGFKVLWSKHEGTDKVLEGTAQEYVSTTEGKLIVHIFNHLHAPLEEKCSHVAYLHKTPIG
ncbi:hypothetical protein Tco_0907993, partial [Tanacetum coccineum]